MDDVIARVFSDLIARTQGPMWFRLILQPLVATVFGIRGGLRLAAHRRDDPGDPQWRSVRFQESLRDVGKVALIGGVLDLAFQWLVLKAIYPVEMLLVVLLIVILPYLAIRTVVVRIAGRRAGTSEMDGSPSRSRAQEEDD